MDRVKIEDIELWDGVSDPRPREVWVPAPGFESTYLVSSFGRLLRIAGGQGTRIRPGQHCRLKAMCPNSKGYVSVVLYAKPKQRSVKMHKLVIESFEGPPPKDEYGYYETHHIKPEEKTNNRLDNLVYKTAKENREEQWHRYYTKGEVVW